jgi:hypothetical protein
MGYPATKVLPGHVFPCKSRIFDQPGNPAPYGYRPALPVRGRYWREVRKEATMSESGRWYIVDWATGSREPVVGFEEGEALVAGEDGALVRVRYDPMRSGELLREGPIIPAEPGWYVLFAGIDSENKLWLRRLPVVAWEASDAGDAYIVNANAGVADDESIIIRAGERVNGDAFGVFHPERRPEPDDVADSAYQFAARLTMERRDAAERKSRQR